MKNGIAQGILGFAVVAAAIAALAQEPVLNISPQRHGNLAAAQNLIREAYDKITVAQQDNRYDLGGHASRAKQLLYQANEEIKLSAEAANRR